MSLAVIFTIGIAKAIVAQEPSTRISINIRERDVRRMRRTCRSGAILQIAASAAKPITVAVQTAIGTRHSAIVLMRSISHAVGVSKITRHVPLMSVAPVIATTSQEYADLLRAEAMDAIRVATILCGVASRVMSFTATIVFVDQPRS